MPTLLSSEQKPMLDPLNVLDARIEPGHADQFLNSLLV
jgi:hypothetical protein